MPADHRSHPFPFPFPFPFPSVEPVARAVPYLLLLLPLLASAQDDRAAGLFTRARQLPLVAQSLTVVATDGEATIELRQTFANDGEDVGQADYRLHLPQGATVVSFAFWDGERRYEASLKERTAAEAKHRDAASRGRSTALVTSDSPVHVFSVYPVRAGELKEIEVVIRVPVERDMGNSRVRLPVDGFLGQEHAPATVLFRLSSSERLVDVFAEGATARVLERTERSAALAFTARRPVEVVWREQGEALTMRAEAVAVEGGETALELRVVLNDAASWAPPYRQVHVLADASFSMRRKASALAALLERVKTRSPAPVKVHAVAERTLSIGQGAAPAELARQVLSGEAEHVAHWRRFAELIGKLECRSAGVRCVVVTDPQLDGLEQAPLFELGLPVVFLADANELAWAEKRLPEGALVYQPESEAPSRLYAIADQLVLPVLDVAAASQGGRVLDFGQQRVRVAQGGMLRLFVKAGSTAPVDVEVVVGGEQIRRQLPVRVLDPASEAGRALRRGHYARVLADWMARWRQSPDEKLERDIVELSLREKIPTAFTALQVDAPELSLADIKPGDPLLTVKPEPGLVDVVAWYPFGEARRLVRDEGGGFVDRFLVPRHWAERVYPVEVFKRYADGTTRAERAFYRLDEQGPAVSVSLDGDLLRIVPQSDDLSTVAVHRDDGRVLALSHVGGRWLLPKSDLTERFSLVARDRAGNRTELSFRLSAQRLSVDSPRRAPKQSRPVAVAAMSLRAHGEDLSVDGRTVNVSHAGKRWTFSFDEAPIRSLELTAAYEPGPGQLLFGTQGGDLVHLSCAGACRARQLGRELAHHPVTGLAPLDGGGVLVGALGLGLYELNGGSLRKSRLDVGSKFITGIARHDRDVLVATAYNGLWRIVGRRAVKTTLPDERVLALRNGPGGVRVWTGERTVVVGGRDRFAPAADVTLPQRSGALTAAARHDGEWYVGGFDQGLFRFRAGSLEPVPLELAVREAQVNALVSHGGSLWLGTEGGLLRFENGALERVHGAAVHELASCDGKLVAATSAGLWEFGSGAPERIDYQRAGNGRFLSVACIGRAVYAGNLEGLYRFEGGRGEQLGRAHGFDAGWVTALAVHQGRLHVGTYDSGVYVVEGRSARRIPGLEGQWVPPRGLRSLGEALWVGGIGMPPVLLDGRGPVAVPVPARDVNDFFESDGAVWMLTTEWLVRVAEPSQVAAR